MDLLFGCCFLGECVGCSYFAGGWGERGRGDHGDEVGGGPWGEGLKGGAEGGSRAQPQQHAEKTTYLVLLVVVVIVVVVVVVAAAASVIAVVEV